MPSLAREPFPANPNRLGADDADLWAVLVVDASGKVVAANASARRLWSAVETSLVGLPLSKLFASPAPSEEAEASGTWWTVLRNESFDRWSERTIISANGGTRGVRMRLERATGGAGTYISTVRLSSPG